MSDSRVLKLDPEIIQSVTQWYEQFGSFTVHALKELKDAIPEALSVEEVNDVGFQLAGVAESLQPSYDGFSRGRKVEREAVQTLGIVSIFEGDIVTAESAKKHLRRTLSGYAQAFVLGRMIKKEKKAIVDRILYG